MYCTYYMGGSLSHAPSQIIYCGNMRLFPCYCLAALLDSLMFYAISYGMHIFLSSSMPTVSGILIWWNTQKQSKPFSEERPD